MTTAPPRPPFEFQYGDEPPSRETAVFQALGGASSCWDDLAGAGGFDSERARAIGDTLLEELARLDEPLLGLATTRQLFDELVTRFDVVADFPSIAIALRALAELVEQSRPSILEYRTVNPEQETR